MFVMEVTELTRDRMFHWVCQPFTLHWDRYVRHSISMRYRYSGLEVKLFFTIISRTQTLIHKSENLSYKLNQMV